MLRYQAGDRPAAEQLFQLLNPTLARYFLATSLSRYGVEDLLQECWLRIHKARGSYRPGEPVLPWILAIARHTRLDSYRRWSRTTGREVTLAEDMDFAREETSPSSERSEAIFALLKRLPEAQREVLIMMKVTGMSLREVALATGSTEAAVKQKAYRAYQTIRAALASGSSPK